MPSLSFRGMFDTSMYYQLICFLASELDEKINITSVFWSVTLEQRRRLISLAQHTNRKLDTAGLKNTCLQARLKLSKVASHLFNPRMTKPQVEFFTGNHVLQVENAISEEIVT